MPLSPELQSALTAAKSGDRLTARKILKQILRENQDDENAWFLFAQVAEKPEQVIASLENVLRLNPYNERARKMLEQVKPKEEPREDPNKPWDYDRFQEKQASLRPEKPEKKSNPQMKLFIGIGIGLLVFICLGVSGYFAVRNLTAPTPTQTTPLVYVSPTPTPDTCTCEFAGEYLARTSKRFDELGQEANAISTGLQNNTFQQSDVPALISSAEVRYNDQRAETPPPCLDIFQKKVVQMFWGWHQAMISLQNGDVNATIAFMNNFVTDSAKIDAEVNKLKDKLNNCFENAPATGQQGFNFSHRWGHC